MFYRASAPGSLILLGEYAVTENAPCLVAAIDQRIHVTLFPRRDDTITVFSSLAQHHTSRHALDDHPALGFVMTCLKQHPLPSGCDIHIHADFSAQLGLGSSAAVTASLCHVLAQWCKLPTSVDALWEKGMAVIQAVQGAGSGADLAASCAGGLIAFQQKPLHIQQMPHLPPLVALYSGQKQSTTEALTHTEISPEWTKRMATLTESAIQHCIQANWIALADCLTQGHHLLVERGVCTPVLHSLVNTLDSHPDTTGAKISGAGYGDCVIALGHLSPTRPIALGSERGSLRRQLPVSITSQGVTSC